MNRLLSIFICSIFLIVSCEKENEPNVIDAPILPTNLSWDMPISETNEALLKAGYVQYQNENIYTHISDDTIFWQINYSQNKLSSIVLHYCGHNLGWMREHWAEIQGNGEKYKRGVISWSKICRTPIETTNTIIKLDEAEAKSIIIGKVSYNSTLTAEYTKK